MPVEWLSGSEYMYNKASSWRPQYIKISRSRVRAADSDTSDDNISLDDCLSLNSTSKWNAWIWVYVWQLVLIIGNCMLQSMLIVSPSPITPTVVRSRMMCLCLSYWFRWLMIGFNSATTQHKWAWYFWCFRSSRACHMCLALFLPVQSLLTCFRSSLTRFVDLVSN